MSVTEIRKRYGEVKLKSSEYAAKERERESVCERERVRVCVREREREAKKKR